MDGTGSRMGPTAGFNCINVQPMGSVEVIKFLKSGILRTDKNPSIPTELYLNPEPY
jgi:hypothetical protein